MAITLNPLRMKLPMKLLLIVAFALIFGGLINEDTKRFFYAISLTLKEVLTFVLPVIIFAYLASCILSFKKGVVAFVSTLLVLVFISNFASTILSYGICAVFLEKVNLGKHLQSEATQILTPLWDLSLPEWIKNEYSLISGLVVGMYFSYRPNRYAERITSILKDLSAAFLNKIFIPLVPLFILGFVFKLEFDGILVMIGKTYLPIFVFSGIIQALYVAILFGFVTNFKLKWWWANLKNVFPSVIVALTTLSSAASLPFTLQGAERNARKTKDPELVDVIVPATVNIHMIGNCMTVPLLALVILTTYGMPFPPFTLFVTFGFFVALASFAVAGVPSGGIYVMYPLLTSYLGFTPEMIALMTAIYAFFDITITGVNVMGNGAFAIIYAKLFTRLRTYNGDQKKKLATADV